MISNMLTKRGDEISDSNVCRKIYIRHLIKEFRYKN